jgi:hypothetical protein
MSAPILLTRVSELRAGDVQVFNDAEHADLELRLIEGVHLASPDERIELSDGRVRYHDDVDLYVVENVRLAGSLVDVGQHSEGLWPGDDPVYVRREYRIAEEPELFTGDASRDDVVRVTRIASRDVIHVSGDASIKAPDKIAK